MYPEQIITSSLKDAVLHVHNFYSYFHTTAAATATVTTTTITTTTTAATYLLTYLLHGAESFLKS